MNKQLPILAGTVALSACNSGKINFVDQITDGELVTFCQEQVKCADNVYQDYYLFQCVDSIRDEQHRAISLQCEEEFTDLLACEMKEAPEKSCRSDFDELSDYEDYLEDLEEEYYENYDACDDEEEDYSDCIDKFLGIDDESSNEEETYGGYYDEAAE